MDRRTFLKYSGVITSGVMLGGGVATHGFASSAISVPRMRLHWQKWMTTRPYQPDVDDGGKVWFGSSKFFCYDPRTRTTELIDSAYLEGKPYSTCLCQGEKVYVLTQKSPDLFIYHRNSKSYTKAPLPDPESNIWFGRRVPGDPRIYLYVRNKSALVVWDTDLEKGRVVPYPETMDLWSGFYVEGDSAIYSFTLDAKPCRLVRFDLKSQRFEGIIPAPEPGLEITGVNPVGGTVYCADRFTGRIFPFHFESRKWGEPLHAPGLGLTYGFVGMGTSYRQYALFCLSTYKGSMKWDFNTNKYLSSGEENIGIDGKPHHFINKYLVLDTKRGKFGFLEARGVKGERYPLICYSIVVKDQLIITGYDLRNVDAGLSPMGEKEGELLVFQSLQAGKGAAIKR